MTIRQPGWKRNRFVRYIARPRAPAGRCRTPAHDPSHLDRTDHGR